MLFGREQFTITTEMNGEIIDKLYAKELIPTPIEEFEKLSDEEKKLHKPYPFNQRTYEVRPGIIATDMTEKVHDKYQKLIDSGLLPIPRFGKPEDVADMVEACCTGLMDYAAGQVLNADGGFSLRRL